MAHSVYQNEILSMEKVVFIFGKSQVFICKIRFSGNFIERLFFSGKQLPDRSIDPMTICILLQDSNRVMAFFQKIKSAGLQTKLKGELALIDRESRLNQQAFGVELYDLLDQLSNKNQPMSSLLGTQSQQIKQIYDACVLDIRLLQDERDAKEQEVEHLQANRDRAPPVYSNREKLARAGDWVASNSKETKIKGEMVLLDRKIKQAKEKFGVDVFQYVVMQQGGGADDQKKKKGLLGGVKAGITNSVSKLSPAETKIQECIQRVQATNKQIQSRRDRKEREIQRLEQETY